MCGTYSGWPCMTMLSNPISEPQLSRGFKASLPEAPSNGIRHGNKCLPGRALQVPSGTLMQASTYVCILGCARVAERVTALRHGRWPSKPNAGCVKHTPLSGTCTKHHADPMMLLCTPTTGSLLIEWNAKHHTTWLNQPWQASCRQTCVRHPESANGRRHSKSSAGCIQHIPLDMHQTLCFPHQQGYQSNGVANISQRNMRVTLTTSVSLTAVHSMSARHV